MGNSRKNKFDAKHIEAVTATIATDTVTTADIGTATVDDLTLSSTYYGRLYIPCQKMHSTGGATWLIETGSTANATIVEEFLAFDQGTVEMASFGFQMPSDWKVGTAIKPMIHWMTTGSTGSTAVAQQYVGWGLSYVVRDVLASTVSANTVTDIIYAGTTMGMEIQTTNWSDISMASYDIDSVFTASVFRNADGTTDSFSTDAALIGITMVYEIDTPGTTSAALSSK